jgi:hypothetical protein
LLFGIVEKVEAEIEKPARHRFAVDKAVLLDQMPAARPNDKDSEFSPSLYSFPFGFVKLMVRRIASRRLTWPSTMFPQVGELASSKSAMNIFAPDLSALITILRSVAP